MAHQGFQPGTNNNSSSDIQLLPGITSGEDSGLLNKSSSREVLEPTMKNFKRLELKNQRRDMQSSIVSSSINGILAIS